MDTETCKVLIAKAITVAALLYAAYTAAFCPCGVLYSCHLTELYTALAIAAAVIFYFNGFRVVSYSS